MPRTSARGTYVRPNVITLQACDFPIMEQEVNGYRVLVIPQRIRDLFDHEGAHVVRILSRTIAATIPDFGGRASGELHSLLPHQDHLDPTGDPRRFLMLTKHKDGARGSRTIIMMERIARHFVPLEEAWLQNSTLRARLGHERSYDPRFLITEEQYDRCFDTRHGYQEVIAEVMSAHGNAAREISIRLGILGFLIRGPSADMLMIEGLHMIRDWYIEERWEHACVLIIDNPRVFHARDGGNLLVLQRNFGI